MTAAVTSGAGDGAGRCIPAGAHRCSIRIWTSAALSALDSRAKPIREKDCGYRETHLRPYSEPFSVVTAPNQLWCMDFKGYFSTSDGA